MIHLSSPLSKSMYRTVSRILYMDFSQCRDKLYEYGEEIHFDAGMKRLQFDNFNVYFDLLQFLFGDSNLSMFLNAGANLIPRMDVRNRPFPFLFSNLYDFVRVSC